MGLRQPSKTAVFFAQAKAGAQQQKEAREKIKKPQALGGAASAGTEMVAATTQAQKEATQQVKDVGQKAATELKADTSKLQSSTAQAITGMQPVQQAVTTQPVTAQPIAPRPVIQPIAPKYSQASLDKATTELNDLRNRLKNTNWMQFGLRNELKGNIKAKEDEVNYIKTQLGSTNIEEVGKTGDLAAVQKQAEIINNTIADINKQITNLDTKLQTANAEDAKKILDEKNRLDELLKTYQDKLTVENLGEIAGPSTIEQQMAEREALLASEGQDVAKLKSIFGPSWKAGRYGALASQIYGKDLESIQEAAAAGLEAKTKAEQEADTAVEQYQERLKTGKKEYENVLKTAQDKLDILQKTPQELSGYTKTELTKLFGKDADNLFTFDPKTGKVVGTTASSTRAVLNDRLTKLTSQQAKIGGAESAARSIQTQSFDTAKSELFGNAQTPSYIQSSISSLDRLINDAKSKKQGYESIPRWQRKQGHSQITSRLDNAINIGNVAIANIKKLEQQARDAEKKQNTDELIRIKNEIGKERKKYDEINNLINA